MDVFAISPRRFPSRQRSYGRETLDVCKLMQLILAIELKKKYSSAKCVYMCVGTPIMFSAKMLLLKYMLAPGFLFASKHLCVHEHKGQHAEVLRQKKKKKKGEKGQYSGLINNPHPMKQPAKLCLMDASSRHVEGLDQILQP